MLDLVVTFWHINPNRGCLVFWGVGWSTVSLLEYNHSSAVEWRLSLRSTQHYFLPRSPLARCSDIYTAWVGIIHVQTSRLTLLWCASVNTLQKCCNSATFFCIRAAEHVHFSWRQRQTGERSRGKKRQNQRRESAGRIAVNKLLPVSNQTRGQSPDYKDACNTCWIQWNQKVIYIFIFIC